MNKKLCPNCRTGFKAKRKSMIYCSKYCYEKAHYLKCKTAMLIRAKKQYEKAYRKNCAICGIKLSPNKNTMCRSCSKLNESNPQWKGEKVKYRSLHRWVERHKPKIQVCEKCNSQKSYDLANISGLYKRDINDYEWLCRGCHMKKDYMDGIRIGRGSND